MKILKLLNNYFTIFLFMILIIGSGYADDKAVDIWNIDKTITEKQKKKDQISSNKQIDNDKELEKNIYETKSIEALEEIELDKNIITKDVKIIGLYDPELNGLKINMWENTDGDQLKSILKNLNKMKLSQDAKGILNIALLTNAHYPDKNISLKEFSKIKSNWIIKNSDLKLLEDYVVTNQLVNDNPELVRYFVDQNLSQSNLEKSCQIFNKISNEIQDKYLSKFKIYCLVNGGKLDQAQLIFDLKKELGFKDNYFENKINFLFGFEEKVDEKISNKSILDFHLAHKTNPNFVYEPKEKTDKRYQVKFLTKSGTFKIDNVKRGASVIGSAGSGKTESVVYGFLKHFSENCFCGIIHDYKDFELTEMAYPLFKESCSLP